MLCRGGRQRGHNPVFSNYTADYLTQGGSDARPIFPEEESQCLICAKPWTLNPSQTLINALDVGPHRGRVTLLRPDPCPVSEKGIFSSSSSFIYSFNQCL
ncbi:hypothetical protein Q5P01_024258 [Channa striata]|uniref:Uncharacterized protein n=1 Tax=Channa striata TaxID=64152 RepID=A0AA88LMV6_CHASR|nr:hypothetical protein Q5P01_024258 [Channa striata]